MSPTRAAAGGALALICLLASAGHALAFTNAIAQRVSGYAGPADPPAPAPAKNATVAANITANATGFAAPADPLSLVQAQVQVGQGGNISASVNVTALDGPELRVAGIGAGAGAPATLTGLVTQTAATLHAIPSNAIADVVDFLTKQSDLLSDALNTKIKRALDLTTGASSLGQQAIALHRTVLPQAASALLSGTGGIKALASGVHGSAAAALGAKVDGIVAAAKSLIGLATAVGADVKDTASQAHLLLTTAIVEKLNILDALLEKALSVLETLKANKGPLLSAKITLHQLPLKALSVAVQRLAAAVANTDDVVRSAAEALLGRLGDKVSRIGALIA